MIANYLAVRGELFMARRDAFRQQLSDMGMKKKQLDDLVAGFTDGFNDAINQLIQRGLITTEAPKE